MAFRDDKRSLGFYILTVFFAIYVLFLYGPTITITILSFQGPNGGLTFPMNGSSFHWFVRLFQKQSVGDFAGSIRRSLILGAIVMTLTVTISIAAGLAYRKGFKGSTPLFYLAMASLIIPSILVSLGIGIMFSQSGVDTTWYGSALGAHLTWTLPFGLLIMFAVFNRFNPAYEEAGRDLGATSWQNLQHVVLPIIAPSIFGIALFGFTLSYDEFPRTYLTGGTFNTLPLEIMGMTTSVTTPVLYALGTVTTAVSFTVIMIFLGMAFAIQRRRIGRGSDAGRAFELVRLLVVNPNTTAGMTETIGIAARSVAAPGTVIDALNPSMGPVSIEGYYDEAFALPGLLTEIAAAERRGCDGAVIACFDDTGLDAARALAAMPVVGICEAAMHMASLIAGKFAVVTTLSRSIPPLEMLARRYGVGDRCRIRASEIPVLALEHPTPAIFGRLLDECRRAVTDDHAEAIILGCAGMTVLAAKLATELGLPVIDGVVAGVKLVEALVGLGLKTSKTGGYAKPLPKPYLGLLEPFAPKS